MLLLRYGGLYCDADTICMGALHRPLHEELAASGCAAVVADEALLHECGLNVGLFRRGSYLTSIWRRCLHARLDARYAQLAEFRQENDDPREDGLSWNEILRDLLVPLAAACAALLPGHLRHTLRAVHWHDPSQPQGYDPLEVKAEIEGLQSGEVDLIVLNNNQYSARVKQATREEFLESGGALARMVRAALG